VFISVAKTPARRQRISCDGKAPWGCVLLGYPVHTRGSMSRSLHGSLCGDICFSGRDSLVTLVTSVSSVSRRSVPFGPYRMGRQPLFRWWKS